MFDGKQYGEEIVGLVRGFVEREFAPLKAENEELKARIKALEDRPMPDVIKGDPGEPGQNGADGQNGKDGSDGRGIKDLLIDREGHLIATMDDGTTKDLGHIIGKDGEPGKDGKDGIGWDDFDVEVIDERTFALKFQRGEQVQKYEITIPAMIDSGVYKEGASYVRGDAVTWGGSLWVAQKDTAAKPDTADSGWRLAVKRGRDGKDAKVG